MSQGCYAVVKLSLGAPRPIGCRGLVNWNRERAILRFDDHFRQFEALPAAAQVARLEGLLGTVIIDGSADPRGVYVAPAVGPELGGQSFDALTADGGDGIWVRRSAAARAGATGAAPAEGAGSRVVEAVIGWLDAHPEPEAAALSIRLINLISDADWLGLATAIRGIPELQIHGDRLHAAWTVLPAAPSAMPPELLGLLPPGARMLSCTRRRGARDLLPALRYLHRRELEDERNVVVEVLAEVDLDAYPALLTFFQGRFAADKFRVDDQEASTVARRFQLIAREPRRLVIVQAGERAANGRIVLDLIAVVPSSHS